MIDSQSPNFCKPDELASFGKYFSLLLSENLFMRTLFFPSSIPGGLILLTACCLVGCGGGPETLEISGTVSLKGKSLDQGTIQFIPLDESGSPSGGIIQDGKYHLEGRQGLRPGKYRVVISSGDPNQPDPEGPPGESGPPAKERIPSRYNVASEKNPVTVEVKEGQKNEFNFPIE